MNTKALKAKILDLAIHGKLVPQNPEHESAEKLLEKIRAEKEEKIAKGELKRDKKDSYIFVGDDKRHYEKFADGTVKDIEDEIPFEVPEGWAWCRLPELCTTPIIDGTHQTPTYSDKENGIPFLSSKDVTSGKIDWSKIKYITKSLHEELYKRVAPQINDILLAKNGTTGIAAIVEDDIIFDIYVTLAVIRPNINLCNPHFLLNLVNSDFCKSQFNSHLTGIGVPNLHLVDIKKTLIPLPPLEEQKEINDSLKVYLDKIEILNINKGELQTAIKHAKSKILDLAIHGKLVPQDPSEEPAGKLLKKIRDEKEAKIAAGELKRDKNDSYIYKNPSDNCHYEKFGDKEICIEDEIPFALPEGWCWCRLNSLCSILGDGLHGTPNYAENGEYYFINGNNLKEGKIILKADTRKVDYEEYKKYKKELNSKSVLLSINGTLGNIAFYNNEKIILGKSACYFNLVFEELKPYIFFFFKTNYFKKYVLENATGTTIKNVSLETMRLLLIPLPPVNEQKRIVSKIGKITEMLDTIEQALV